MTRKARLIAGGCHTDERGKICFINDFDMTLIKRFYLIKPSNSTIFRDWRAHKIEQRWFYVIKGSFEIKLIKIDNWESPNPSLPQEIFIISADENLVLHVPKGFGSSIKACEENSNLMVFADSSINQAENDNYFFSSNYFKTNSNFHK